MEDILKRLERQYSAYEAERNSDDEDGMIDIALACELADSIPYLISTIREQKERLKEYELF